ncbi:MAG: nucleoside-diphosphate sugar epimerase/dehydratase [Pseudomonadota bacterium]
MTALAIVVCFAIRFDPIAFAAWQTQMLSLIALTLPISGLVYWKLGLYRGVWRFASLPDVINIMKAVAIMTAVVISVDFVTRQAIVVPRGVAFAFPFILFSALCALRFAYRAFRSERAERKKQRRKLGIPILIVGTGDEAEALIRSLEASPGASYVPVGLVATTGAHKGQVIRNVPVVGTDADFEHVLTDPTVKTEQPKRLVVTDEALRKSPHVNAVMNAAEAAGMIASKLARPIAQENDAGVPQPTLTPIEIEDLLGRTHRRVDFSPIRKLFQGKRVLVTGGGGSIGQELCRQTADLDLDRIMIVDNSEFNLYTVMTLLETECPRAAFDGRLCDVRDKNALEDIFDEFKPDIVLHAAALKHVPMLEREISQAISTNVFGTRNVIDLAAEHKVEVTVMVSTDKVVRPTSVMGATKRIGEMICQLRDAEIQRSNLCGQRIVCVRFGNVLGSSGSVVPRFWDQIRRGGPITVTHPDMVRYFMTVSEAVALILRAASDAFDNRSEAITVYALDMGKPQRIVDLAERMISLAGYRPGEDIAIEFTGPRPGEKLFEELYDSSENVVATDIEGLLAAKVETVDPLNFSDQLDTLNELGKSGTRSELRNQIKKMVSSYAA